jgi:hypothetical protein
MKRGGADCGFAPFLLERCGRGVKATLLLAGGYELVKANVREVSNILFVALLEEVGCHVASEQAPRNDKGV